MPSKVARYVGSDASGHGIYDVTPPIGGESRVIAVHLPTAGGIGFYPPGSAAYVAWWTGDNRTLEAFKDLGYEVERARPVSAADKVREFHTTFGHPTADTPQMISKERALKRLGWVKDEVQELEDAIEAGDLVEIADALADIKYFVEGDAVERGIPLDDVFNEVHRSNMSKLGEDGEPIFYEDGKVAKGPNFFQPDIAAILTDAGWPGE